MADRKRARGSSRFLLGLALFEGVAVLVLEILGARAIAPYFGTSHVVWTAQITATLAHLALGYAVGGWLSARAASGRLAPLLAGAALWLGLFAWLRAPVLRSAAELGQLAIGSFVSASVLFGPIFVALGAVGPLIVDQLARDRRAAGSASGAVLFVSTLGGLAGGWLTALVLVPHVPLRIAFAGCALAIAAMAAVWRALERGAFDRTSWLALAPCVLPWLGPAPVTTLGPAQARGTIVMSAQGATGLVQVLDVPAADARFLVVDGTVQGAIHRSSGETVVEFSDSLWKAGVACQPDAKTALVVGLGAGSLARSLHARGIEPVVVEIDPRVVEAARRHFDLPASIEVVVEDARALIRRERRRFDLVLLDVYRAESFPWHLATREAFTEIGERLAPGGCLVVNAITHAQGVSAGLGRLEAAALDVFGSARVVTAAGDAELVNATLIASKGLSDRFALGRSAERSVEATSDEHSDIDAADEPLRRAWRRALIAELAPEALVD